eukprot:77787_1
MSKKLKSLFKTKRRNDSTSSAFIIFNKPGLSKEYKEHQKAKRIQSSRSTQRHNKCNRSTRLHKSSNENAYDLTLDDLPRLSLSDDEETSAVDVTQRSTKRIHSSSHKTNVNPFMKFAPKPPPERSFITLETSTDRPSVNTMELINKSHRIQTKVSSSLAPNFIQTRSISNSDANAKSKPEWVEPNVEKRIIKNKKVKEITPKITQQSVMVSDFEKHEPLLDTKRLQNAQEVTPKIGSKLTIIPETDDKKDTIEPQVNHAFPKSDLFGATGTNNGAAHSFSWAIPMGDTQSKKLHAIPKRFQNRNFQNKPRWRT